MFCKKCGAKIESYASNCPFCGEPLANNNVQATYSPNQNLVHKEHHSIGEWILAYILTSIPLVGIIMLIVWATDKKYKNDPTFQNWAKSQLVLIVGIGILMSVLILFLSLLLLL